MEVRPNSSHRQLYKGNLWQIEQCSRKTNVQNVDKLYIYYEKPVSEATNRQQE